jgi:hypothetical protein
VWRWTGFHGHLRGEDILEGKYLQCFSNFAIIYCKFAPE